MFRKAALLGVIAVAGWAQGFRATVVGRVTDKSGASVPGAKVTIVNTGTNETRTVDTSETGDYTIAQLDPGQYMLTAESRAFKKEVIREITLETNQQARLDIALEVGAVTETVEVAAVTPLVSSESASVGNVVDQKKIVELPLNGRDYLQLALLQPYVYAPAQGSTLGFRGGFNVAGNSEIANNYIKDGIDNNDETTNQPLHRPVLDAILEFKVLTGTYSAEYGRQAGGQVIVTTKSGANQFHGAAWEFHRNSALDARNFFVPTKPEFKRNQFGGVLGCPVRKDRTFFFLANEGQRRGQQEAGLAVVPPLAMKRGDFTAVTAVRNPLDSNRPFPNNQIPQAAWSRQGAGLLGLYPDPNRNDAQNYVATASGPFALNQFSVRLDHKLGAKDDLFGIYEFADSSEFYALANPLCSARDVPGWGCDELQRTQHAVLVWTHVFGPRVVNEARVGYTRFGFYRLQEDRDSDVIRRLGIGGLTDAGKTPFNDGAPQLTVPGFVTIGGPTNLPQGRHDNTYHYVENMTFIQGAHAMKWGVDIRRFLFNSFFTSFGRGAFNFDGRFTGHSVADLLLGLPFRADRNLGEPFHNALTFSSGYYFQDDWKATPKLTLNLGLRYELNLPPVEKVDKMASFDPRTNTIRVAGDREAFLIPATGALEIRPRAGVGRRLWQTDKNNFAPRFGLAWRPFGGAGTVLRAGYGLFYNYQIVGNGITPLSRNSPFRMRQTAGPFAATERPNLTNAFAVGLPSVVPPGIQEDFKTAYLNQWSSGVQREVARNLVVDVSYLGSQGHKLPIQWNINQALPGAGSVASRRPYPGYGNITGGFVSSIGNSSFHALQVRGERRFSRGLSFVSSYTWGKSIDDGAGVSTGSDSSGVAQNARNLRAERGLSDFDVPQRWVLSWVWDLPFGANASNRAAKALIHGWQVTGILTLQGGRPFTVLTGTDQSNTDGGADRPNVIGEWRVPERAPDRWFNPCTLLANGTRRNCASNDTPAWQVAAPNTFGNAGRNTLRGDGLKNFDFGFYRPFRVTERITLQFRTEFFNLLNHPNFFLPTANSSSGAFGRVARAAFQAQTGAQRQIQFAMKIVF
ncbi:MAG: TonB-dependent receptor [Acidobacteria bacterium]|nr:TonB-dependent receptor [Acidobacteriota bacterium]